MPFLQEINGKLRVRIVVPEGLPPYLPPPHTGKKSLTKALGTGNEREADRLSVPHVAEFLAVIAAAAENQGNPHRLDWVRRYAYHHPGVSPWAPEARLFPPQPALMVPETPEPVTFEPMIKLWAKDTNAPKQGIRNMEAKTGRFAEWLKEHAGHEDMARVTFQNGRDWRDEMISDGDLAPGTIANHLKLNKALFKYAFENEYIPANHMARVKYSPGDGEERDDFTPDERRRILTMARDAEPHIRWCNWICSFHGCRTGEVADATTFDIELVDGIYVLNIRTRNRSKDQRLKTPVSTRKLALHQVVLDYGFIDYVESLPPGPLFPRVKLDAYGRRAGNVTKDLSDWLRNVVEITDPRKPFYSHRHTATSYLRNTLGLDGSPVVKEDIERYILGHGKKGSHAGYGKRWFETLKAAVEVIPNPVEAE